MKIVGRNNILPQMESVEIGINFIVDYIAVTARPHTAYVSRFVSKFQTFVVTVCALLYV